MKKIVAIIVTYNAVPWLERCLGSLQASSVPVQTVIVDNRSTDETVNTIRTRYPQTVLIENQENLGFGQANNIGIRYALEHEATHVLLLNQDAWIGFAESGWQFEITVRDLFRRKLHHRIKSIALFATQNAFVIQHVLYAIM